MPKRRRSNLHGEIDLDAELNRKAQCLRGQDAPSESVPVVTMDNWLDSSNKAKADPQWRDNKKGLGMGSFKAPGMWQYSKKKPERYWAAKPAESLAHRTANILLNRPGPKMFQAYEGDREISAVYREFWVGGDATAFIESIYNFYAIKDTIPQEDIWRIWRCLVGELVPANDQWKDTPAHIIANPDTIWQTGKCIFQILTRGRFFDNKLDILQPIDNGEKFGQFKVETLQKTYSVDLMKYVVDTLAYDPAARPTREQLLKHFNEVIKIYEEGTSAEQPAAQSPGEDLYQPKNPSESALIPKDLVQKHGEVYSTIMTAVNERIRAGRRGPRIVVITDLAKDYDDLIAMILLKELHRLGVLTLVGFVANLMPAERRARFGRGALDVLGLKKVPIAIGSRGDFSKDHKVLPHEFANVTFWPPDETQYEDGQELLRQLFTEAAENEENKTTLLCLSSLSDIRGFAEKSPQLLKNSLQNVVLQGGYNIIDGKLIADNQAQNNKFDLEAAQIFHTFMQDNQIPSTTYTKVATFATPIYKEFLIELDKTEISLGHYLRCVQESQDLLFYQASCGIETRYATYMDQEWYLRNKTSWYEKPHEPDEEPPVDEEILPWLDKVTAYDCLAALGAAGDEVVDALGFLTPREKRIRKDVDNEMHKVVGVPEIPNPVIQEPKLPPLEPSDPCVDGKIFSNAIQALVLGSLLAVKQGLKTEIKE